MVAVLAGLPLVGFVRECAIHSVDTPWSFAEPRSAPFVLIPSCPALPFLPSVPNKSGKRQQRRHKGAVGLYGGGTSEALVSSATIVTEARQMYGVRRIFGDWFWPSLGVACLAASTALQALQPRHR